MSQTSSPSAPFPAEAPRSPDSGNDCPVAGLEREADFFSRQFLNRPAGARLIHAYTQAHQELSDLQSSSEAESRTVRIIVERNLDSLAIEPWFRRGPSRHLLSRKLLLLAYIMECDGCHPEIRQEIAGRYISIVRLLLTVAASGLRMVRGRLQMMIHGLV